MLSPSRSNTVAETSLAPMSDSGPIRLLLLTDTPVLMAGGSERFLRNLVRHLPAERYRITIVQLTDKGQHEDAVYSLADLSHVTLRSMPMEAVYGRRGWRAFDSLKRLAKRERFDVIQSQHDKSDLLNALLPTARGTVRISNRRDMGFNKSSRMRMASRFLNRRYDCVVAPAQPILSKLKESEKLDPKVMLCIPNGVDTERFAPLPPPERSLARQSMGLAEDAVVFGCLASFTPVKRHQDLLQAFAIVHAQLPQARLVLLGDGPLRGAVEAQIDALGLGHAVQLSGNLTDVAKALAVLDVSVLASSTEGMSNAVLESMACGLPLVATSVGGNLQLVDNGMTGIQVPPLDPVTLGQAMLTLALSADLRDLYGAAGRAKVQLEYSLVNMALAFDQLYLRLLNSAS